MKEIKLLTEWADNITNEASRLGQPVKGIGDRPIARSQDIMYQAQRKFPDRSPEQALSLFINDKMQDNEKMDYEQNKLINAQKQDNLKLRRTLSDLSDELHNHEQTAQQTDQEVARLKDLSVKLRPAGELTKQVAQATSQQIEKMMKDVEEIRLKPGMTPDKQKELEQKIADIKSGGLSSGEVKNINQTLEVLTAKQEIDDQMFNTVMNRLEDTQQKLEKKEERFRQSNTRNQEMQKSWGARFKELNATIKNIEDKTAKADAAADELDKKLNKLAVMEPALEKLAARSVEEPDTSEFPELTPQQAQQAADIGQQAITKAQSSSSEILPQDWQDLEDIYNTEKELAGHASTAREPISLDPDEEKQMSIKEDLSKYKNYPKFIAWANQFRPVIMKMFRNKFYDDEDIYPDDALADAVDNYMVYLKNVDNITKPMMDRVLVAIKNDLDDLAKSMGTGRIPKQSELFKDNPQQQRPSEKPVHHNYRPDYEWPPTGNNMSESLVRDFAKGLDKLTGGY